jgi:hypothetical protein
MPIADIKDYAKTHNVPLTAVKCSPMYDENKQRVSKGNAICNKGWKDKGRYELCKTKLENEEAAMWMMQLSKTGLYVVDIDVKGSETAKDVLCEEVYDMLFNASQYIVETGSKGLHFYFKMPEGIDKQKNSINADFAYWFKTGKEATVDIIFDSIITEGSSYKFQDVTYKYINIKPGSSINDTTESNSMWSLVYRPKNEIVHPKNNVDMSELAEHLENIPNDKRNWDEWYKMAQTIFNINADGLDMFMKWSAKNPIHNDKEAIKLWKGLTKRADGRSMGSILYLSRQANADVYNEIRSRYAPISYEALKELIEINHFFVQEPKPMYVRIREYDSLCYSPASFKELLMDWNYPVVVKGEVREVSFYTTWSKDPSKRKYVRIGYFPNEEDCPTNTFNSFVAAKASFLPNCDPVDIKPIMDHINIMANHDQASATFLLQYLAQIVQQPAILPGIAILLYSEEGAGKDILIDWFGKYILGEHQYYKVGDICNMFKGFNALMDGKLLVHADELSKQTLTKARMEDLKRIITNGKITIEKKGIDSVEQDSYSRIFMTTNNRDALQISNTNRRFAVYYSSSEKRKDAEYFKNLVAFLSNQDVKRTFYDFLMTVDISDFHHTKRPETEIYNEMKQASMDKLLVWILNSDTDFDEERLKTLEWMAKYNAWAETNKERVYNATSFGLAMNVLIDKKMGIVKTKPNNVRYLTIKRNEVLEWMGKEGLIDLEE